MRLGEPGAVAEFGLLLALAYRHLSCSCSAGPGPAVLLPLLSAPLALPLLRVVRAGGDPRRLNAVLAGTARLSLVFSALLAFGLALPGLL